MDLHWRYAKQAQRNFGGKLPIVVVDVDKCLQSEKQKLNEMISNYKINPTFELLGEIKQKIKNNQKTCVNFHYGGDFFDYIDVEALEDMLVRPITERDLQECYKGTAPEDREDAAELLKKLIKDLDRGQARE